MRLGSLTPFVKIGDGRAQDVAQLVEHQPCRPEVQDLIPGSTSSGLSISVPCEFFSFTSNLFFPLNDGPEGNSDY